MLVAGYLSAIDAGPYLNAYKAIAPLLLLIIWGRLLTWTDKDTVVAHLPRGPLMAGLLGGLIVGYGLFFFVPDFLIALGLLVLVLLVEVGVYLGLRNAKVGLKDLKGEIQNALKGITPKEKAVKSVAGNVQFLGSKSELLPAPNQEDPTILAYSACQSMLTPPLLKEAEQIELQHREGVMASVYSVDGVAYNGTSFDRNTASAAIEYLKQMSGMNVQDKRKPQTGTMKVSINGKRKELRINTRGSTAGETMSILVEAKNRFTLTLDSAGFTPDQLAKIRTDIGTNVGVVLVTAPSRQGLTSLLYALLRGHDAFVQHIQTVERNAEADLDGITQTEIPPNAPAGDELKQVSWVVSQQPDVMMVNEVQDPRSAVELLKYALSGKRVYIGMRSPGTLEAITDWRKLVGDDRSAGSPLVMVVAGRVLRKLCSACKVGYTPEPTTLRKLNMDPDKVGQLFQARSSPMRDQKGNVIPCDFCHDLHFKGRTGVYELFMVDDEVRQQIVAGGSTNQLKALFRKQRGRMLLEQAMALVEKGETSVQEVLRVLKPQEPPKMGQGKPKASAPA